MEDVVTSGPVVATYGPFQLRSLTLVSVEYGSYRLPFYRVSVGIPPRPEVAFALTEDLTISRIPLKRAIVRQLRADREAIARGPTEEQLRASGAPPEAIEATLQRLTQRNRQQSERIEAVTQGLHGLPQDISFTGESLTDPKMRVLPLHEDVCLARFGPFSVRRFWDAWQWLLPFPLGVGVWEEPWKVRRLPGLTMLEFQGIIPTGISLNKSLHRPLDPYASVTRSDVIKAARSIVASNNAYTKRQDYHEQHPVEHSPGEPIDDDLSPESVSILRRNHEALRVALEALEAEEAGERGAPGK